jgi:hypothetical protein
MPNLTLVRPINSTWNTTSGAQTIGFDNGNVAPGEVLVVSAGGTTTLTMPVIQGSYPSTGNGVGVGHGQRLEIVNLAAQSVIVAAPTGHTLYGSSASIAQNIAAEYVADAVDKKWIRLRG